MFCCFVAILIVLCCVILGLSFFFFFLFFFFFREVLLYCLKVCVALCCAVLYGVGVLAHTRAAKGRASGASTPQRPASAVSHRSRQSCVSPTCYPTYVYTTFHVRARFVRTHTRSPTHTRTHSHTAHTRTKRPRKATRSPCTRSYSPCTLLVLVTLAAYTHTHTHTHTQLGLLPDIFSPCHIRLFRVISLLIYSELSPAEFLVYQHHCNDGFKRKHWCCANCLNECVTSLWVVVLHVCVMCVCVYVVDTVRTGRSQRLPYS